MSLARVKTWISGEVLTASDLNAEFNNILNNPGSLIGTASNFTGTLTGCTTAPTYTVYVTLVGNVVTIDVPQVSATSNAATKTLTGMPAAYRPATAKQLLCAALDNGGSFVASFGSVGTNGTITFNPSLASTTWTTSGTASVGAFSFTYTTN